MAAKKRGLGERGLGALLAGSKVDLGQDSSERDGEFRDIPVDLIQRGQFQPRRDMDPAALQELADSIRQQGVMQPVVVRPLAEGRYELIAGERRWRASQMAELDRIPAIIRCVPDEAAIAMALIENIQRENLNPIEEAFALQAHLLAQKSLWNREVSRELTGRGDGALAYFDEHLAFPLTGAQQRAGAQIAADLARDLRAGRHGDTGSAERDLTGRIPVSPLGNPVVDTPPPLRAFGDVLVAPLPAYRVGQRVTVRFAGTHPNSDLRRGDTYLSVERAEGGRWVRVHDDGDWSTMIVFHQVLTVTDAEITWDVPEGTAPGRYRIVYTASGRRLDGTVFPVRGQSPEFDIT